MGSAPSTYTEKVYAKLRNQILNGEIAPGTQLREEGLAARLGVSRTPVRTALKMLLSEKVLIKGQDRTLRVASVSSRDIEDIFLARKIVEAEIADLACRRGTKTQIDRLRHYVLDEKSAYDSQNTVLIIHAERQFHGYIGEMSGNELLVSFQETVNNRVLLVLALSSTLEEEVGNALEEHRAIVKAIEEGDPSEARKAMLAHLGNVEVRIRKRIRE